MMSAWLMPLARYSRTSKTEILVPATHGLPLRTPGVQVTSGEDDGVMGCRLSLKRCGVDWVYASILMESNAGRSAGRVRETMEAC